MLHYSDFFFFFFSSVLSPNSRGVWNRGSAVAEGFFIVRMRADSQMEDFFFSPLLVFSAPSRLFFSSCSFSSPPWCLDVLPLHRLAFPPPLPICTPVSQSARTYSPSSRLDSSLRPVSSRLLQPRFGFVPVLLSLKADPVGGGSRGGEHTDAQRLTNRERRKQHAGGGRKHGPSCVWASHGGRVTSTHSFLSVLLQYDGALACLCGSRWCRSLAAGQVGALETPRTSHVSPTIVFWEGRRTRQRKKSPPGKDIKILVISCKWNTRWSCVRRALWNEFYCFPHSIFPFLICWDSFFLNFFLPFAQIVLFVEVVRLRTVHSWNNTSPGAKKGVQLCILECCWSDARVVPRFRDPPGMSCPDPVPLSPPKRILLKWQSFTR